MEHRFKELNRTSQIKNFDIRNKSGRRQRQKAVNKGRFNKKQIYSDNK